MIVGGSHRDSPLWLLIMKNHLLLFLFLCFGAHSSFALETVLQYSLTETRTPLPSVSDAKKKEKEVRLSSEKKIVLGDNYFSVKEGKQERIYDFKKRRIYYLDHKLKTRFEMSLFSDPAFRVSEFHHRLTMDEAVVKAGGQPLENYFVLESIFGVEGEPTQTKITEDSSKAEKTQFLNDGKVISEITWDAKKLAPEGNMFARFLVYDNSLHPRIRKKIVESRQVPRAIRSELFSSDSKDQFVLVLDSLKTRPDQGYKIPRHYSLSKKKSGAGPFAPLLDKLIQSSETPKGKALKHDKDWFLKKAGQAEASKNYLDAALLILEYGLQTGDQKTSSEQIKKLAAHQKDDAELDRFLRSLGIAGPEQAQRSIVELGKLDRKKVSRPHMIDIMIANQQSVLGRLQEAQKRMLGALKSNPFMAGAYKDLGDMFYADFDMASAWQCWDFARKQAPEHFMLQPISDYEADLLKNHPDFF